MAPARKTPVAVTRALRRCGEEFGSWRRLRELTVDEVADRAGVGPRTVTRLEDGQGVTFENALRVARALGVLDILLDALDPYASDVGRLRADAALPERVRRPRPT